MTDLETVGAHFEARTLLSALAAASERDETSVPSRTLVHKNQVLERWCADVGRDPGGIVRSMTINDMRRIADLDAFHAVGVRHVIVGMQPADLDEAAVRQPADWRDRAHD